MKKDEWVDVGEAKRTYYFPGGHQMVFHNVRRLKVSSSGVHYLELSGDEKAIVQPGWHAIGIFVERWVA